MRTVNYQNKIIVSILVFLTAAGLLFGLGFPWLLAKGATQLGAIMEQKKTVLELRQEQRNIELAKKDLEDIQDNAILPEDFFGKDTALVSELAVLEGEAVKYNVEFAFTISGTVGSATKAKTTSELYVIPFTMRLVGDFADVVAYMDFLEHADTIFTVRSVSVGSASKTTAAATLIGTLYLKK